MLNCIHMDCVLSTIKETMQKCIINCSLSDYRVHAGFGELYSHMTKAQHDTA